MRFHCMYDYCLNYSTLIFLRILTKWAAAKNAKINT